MRLARTAVGALLALCGLAPIAPAFATTPADLFQGGNSQLSRDGREIVKKLFQRMATFDVVNQRLHGNARANKHRCAAQDVGV